MAIIVTTNAPTSVTPNSFQMNGQVNTTSGVYNYGFELDGSDWPQITDMGLNFFTDVPGLYETVIGQNTAHSYRAWIEKSITYEKIYGSIVNFTTLPSGIVFSPKPAIDITDDDATLRGIVTDIGYFSDRHLAFDFDFQYKEEASGEVQEFPWSFDIFYGDEFSDPINFGSNFNPHGVYLNLDTKYYFRCKLSYNWHNEHAEYTGWLCFTTNKPREVVTEPATNIGNLKATLNGECVNFEEVITERGFIYHKEGDPNTITTKEIGTFYNDEYSLVAGDDSLPLVHNTKYMFMAYAISVEGTLYGSELSFTTTNEKPTVTTQIATDLEALSVTGNGTIVGIGGGEPYCDKRGFEVTYSFSGTLEECNVWKGHGFTGDVTLNPVTGLWGGTLTKLYEEDGEFSIGVFQLVLDDLICDKNYLYRAKAKNTAGWGHGSYLAFTTDDLLLRKTCTCGIFTIMLCAYVKPIPSGSTIKRRGFRWGVYNTAQEYDIHEDGDFEASAMIGPIDTISFVCSNDESVYDTIVDSASGFLTAGFVAGKFIDISATGAIDPVNEGQFKIISVTADTITINVRNTLVSEVVTGVTIVDLFALYIVDLDPETDYYSVAYIAVEDSEGNWTVQEGNVAMATTIENPFDFEGYDKVEFYKPDRAQNYKEITRKIEVEVIAEQQYIDLAGGRRFLPIKNHLIQTKENAVTIGTNYKDRFKNIKSLMSIECPTPAPLQNEDTLDIGFGRIRFKEDDKGIVNFMPDGEGLMLFRYRMVMMIRKINVGYAISKEDIDYVATMELEEA
jgi:hypothetical protein